MMTTKQALPGLEGLVDEVPIVDQSHAEARRLFEQVLGDVPFGDQYQALLEEGWDWRKAAYIAWQAMPREGRHPQTMGELASMLGLSSTKSFRDWRAQNPAIDMRVAKLAASVIWERLPDVVDALMESASDPGYKHAPDRKLALEMSGLYVPRSKLGVSLDEEGGEFEEKSEADLARLAAKDKGVGE